MNIHKDLLTEFVAFRRQEETRTRPAGVTLTAWALRCARAELARQREGRRFQKWLSVNPEIGP